MLRNTRGQLVEMLRDECGISSNSSRGADNLANLQRLIARTYEFLVDEADWTFLRVDKDAATKELEAGQRYYDFPVEMDVKYTIGCDHFYGNVWVPLGYGIDMADYTAMNPELDQRADPAIKWSIKNGRQFEVWPLPASTGFISNVAGENSQGPLVRFTGRKMPERLVSNDSRADMDDQLIVLYCAAEVLAKKNQKDADLKLAAAKQRLIQMKRLYTDRRKVRIGMAERYDPARGWPRIRAFPASN